MEQSPLNSRMPPDESDISLREWSLKARKISRENTRSRRFSASYIASLREDSRSFRSNINISSTASSPGYNLKSEEIDPSTYSFSAALRALQARSVNTWECLSPEGFVLNSKWNEAEKYICNPLSGEVPMECLSAKTLGGRSFRNLTSRITMSAPLIYPSHSRFVHTTPPYLISTHNQEQIHNINNIPIKDQIKKVENMTTRDVGVQSTSTEITSTSTTTPTSSPLTKRISTDQLSTARGNSSTSSPNIKPNEEVEVNVVGDEEEETKRDGEKERRKVAGKKQEQELWRCSKGGCLSMRNLWRRDKHKPRNKNKCFYPTTRCCS